MQMNRRTLGKLVLGAGALAPLGWVRNGWAQDKTINIGIWGGAQGELREASGRGPSRAHVVLLRRSN
jgi:hypothetical protein